MTGFLFLFSISSIFLFLATKHPAQASSLETTLNINFDLSDEAANVSETILLKNSTAQTVALGSYEFVLGIENPEDSSRPPQFGLASLLAAVAILGILLGILKAMGPLPASAFSLLV